MREEIGKVVLDMTNYSGKDLYSDGDIEDVLLDIVKNHDEEEYNSIIMDKKDWAVLYHLSPVRQNIISFLDIEPDSTVLEIGAGCGAITGALASKAKKVTCIELSKRRSTINAYRNKEYDNIEIKVGNFTDVEKGLTEKFDYITLIGVLEYAASYINMEQPYDKFLQIISKHLKPNGKIIVAIENRLGMKYWAGCKEDHTGQYFSGLDEYQEFTHVKTFSKAELTELFVNNGMYNIEFYYPYPDYKLPMRIYSDEYLPGLEELNNNMRNFDNSRMLLFDEGKAFNSVIKEGCFPQFANSFLVVMQGGKGL
ncbi:MAG: class I SAM-dependent methyltransferase [Lachnospiraceae bacterium]|nr:class I SAM-dependent methyltransferase [Lachnospiraceae bacterium]